MEQINNKSDDIFWKHYKKVMFRDVNSASGARKARTLFKPSKHAKLVCKEFALKAKESFESCFIRNWGTSPLQTILEHIDCRNCLVPKYWYCPDIKGAFPSITWEKFTKVLEPEEVTALGNQDDLRAFCFTPESEGSCLPQGAPSSNPLFHIYMSKVDEEILRVIGQAVSYTRYCDDMLFASSFPITTSTKKKIMSVMRSYGLVQSDKKTRKYDLNKQVMECFGYTLRLERATASKPQKLFVSLRQEYLNHLRGYYYSVGQKGAFLRKKDISRNLGLFNGLLRQKKSRGWATTQTEKKIVDLIEKAKGRLQDQPILKNKNESTNVPFFNNTTSAKNLVRRGMSIHESVDPDELF